ncbi:hypothetical protein KOR42_38750 [Thalassoglobus neptunius]|uniref:Uncharacterized protein n=1 Tax=Thalassoglobus neptunius TaxID=1938619 RepID=A0A5C5WIF5_9PLAN|nr:hypothetical protein KOR42_38750 [Thalassoglobus neptunius]
MKQSVLLLSVCSVTVSNRYSICGCLAGFITEMLAENSYGSITSYASLWTSNRFPKPEIFDSGLFGMEMDNIAQLLCISCASNLIMDPR